MRRAALALIASALATGCFTTTVRSGHAPAREAAYEKWHHGYLGGLIEGSGPYDLRRMCPEGWAEITTSLEPVQTLTSLFTLFVYMPQTVTIVCATPGAPPAAPRSGYGTPDAPYPAGPPAPQALPPISGPLPPPASAAAPAQLPHPQPTEAP